VLALRYGNWKVVFMEQRCRGAMQTWIDPFARLPRTATMNGSFITTSATFKEFPPVQHPNCFTIDAALKMMAEAGAGKALTAASLCSRSDMEIAVGSSRTRT
jgi:hypothetical protein